MSDGDILVAIRSATDGQVDCMVGGLVCIGTGMHKKDTDCCFRRVVVSVSFPF
jgi:hypothetical protein